MWRRKSWQALYDSVAAEGFDKQEYLKNRLGPHAWSYDLHKGTLSLKREAAPEAPLVFDAQFLGFEDPNCDRWTWAWALDWGFPDKMFAAVNAVKAEGERRQEKDLLEPVVRLKGRCGHQFALVAAALTGASFYYPCELEKGSLYFAVTDPAFRQHIKDPLARMARVFPAALQNLGHRIDDEYEAFRRYALFYGQPLTASWQAGFTYLDVGDKDRKLIGRFDGRNRFLGLDARQVV